MDIGCWAGHACRSFKLHVLLVVHRLQPGAEHPDLRHLGGNAYTRIGCLPPVIKPSFPHLPSPQAYLIQAPEGNVLWDCVGVCHPDIVADVEAAGGIAAIAISHPHFYNACVDWAEAFDCKVRLAHAAGQSAAAAGRHTVCWQRAQRLPCLALRASSACAVHCSWLQLVVVQLIAVQRQAVLGTTSAPLPAGAPARRRPAVGDAPQPPPGVLGGRRAAAGAWPAADAPGGPLPGQLRAAVGGGSRRQGGDVHW